MKTMRKYACWLVLGTVLTPGLLFAHNGSVAVAVPLKGITVDGDLSEWPADLVQYPIEHLSSGVRPVDGGDLGARFRVGYDAARNALYVGVEVPHGSYPAASGDRCGIVLDPAHRISDYPWAPGAPDIYLYSSSGTGPSQREESLGLGPEDALAVGDNGKLRQYEWKLDLDSRSSELSLSPGMVLGLHLAVGVYDADDSWSVFGWATCLARFAAARSPTSVWA